MSTVLTENIVLSRTRSQDLRNVRKLNCWGNELTDISIVRSLVNVEVLSLSLNNIRRLADFAHCPYLQELYLRKNQIRDINEVHHLRRLPYLRKLWLAENPCSDVAHYRPIVIRALPKLEMLDNQPVTEDEVEDALESAREVHDPTMPAPVAEPKVNVESSSNLGQPCSPDVQGQDEAEEYDEEEPSDECPNGLEQEIERVRTITYNDGVQGSPKVQQRYSYPPSNEVTSTSRAVVAPAPVTRSTSVHEYSSHNGNQTFESNHAGGGHNREAPAQQQQSVDTRIPSAYAPVEPSQVTTTPTTQQSNGYRFSGRTSISPSSVSATRSFTSNNKMLSKGGRNRNANILSAVLCLIKDLDFASLEVVETAIHCQMEEMDEGGRAEVH